MTATEAAQGFVDAFNNAFLFPLITLLMAMAFLVFLWGCFEYIRYAGSETGRETGRQHILYGTIGMLVMLSAYAVLSLAAGTFGIQVSESPYDNQNIAATVSAPAVPFVVKDDSLTPVREALIATGNSDAMADAIVTTLQYSKSLASLQANLRTYVQQGLIGEEVVVTVLRAYE